MKHIQLLFFGLFFTIAGTTHAQTNKFDIGVEGGPSLISLRGNTIIDQFHASTAGFSGGFSFQYNFQKVISLRTNIAFERKGSVLTSPVVDILGNSLGEASTYSNFEYLTLPILVRATFGKKIQFFVNAGPYFGYLIQQNFVTKGKNLPTTKSEDKSIVKQFDTGISTGVGISVPIKTKFAFSFEVRNNLGLYNVSSRPVINSGTIKTNSTNFLFGFTYKLGQRTLATE